MAFLYLLEIANFIVLYHGERSALRAFVPVSIFVRIREKGTEPVGSALFSW
jgi:hypothetical protein